MSNRIKRIGLGLALAVFGLGIVAAMPAPKGTAVQAATKSKVVYRGTVNVSKMAIRPCKSRSVKPLKILFKGDRLKVLTVNKKWVRVKSGKVTGYAIGRFIDVENGTAAEVLSKGEQVVEYAKKFLGNPYVYGGTSLTHGTDCSGYTMRIFQHFGKRIPRTSSSQRHAGTRVSSLSKAKPGDLICYYGHVAIYMGNNKIIHASNPQNDICIRNNARYRSIASTRRIVE